MSEARFFVDTNLFVYFRDATEVVKQKQAAEWMTYVSRQRSGRTSVQVLNEFYVTVTQKLKIKLPREEAWKDVSSLIRWNPVSIDTAIMHQARAIQLRYEFSWWDSLIVASAMKARCEYLLTEDLSDGQDLDGVRVVNPFTVRPDDLIR